MMQTYVPEVVVLRRSKESEPIEPTLRVTPRVQEVQSQEMNLGA
jgi:hypothetical protein